jgi:hypothetical protein
MLHINRERTDAYYYIKKIAKINLVDKKNSLIFEQQSNKQ